MRLTANLLLLIIALTLPACATPSSSLPSTDTLPSPSSAEQQAHPHSHDIQAEQLGLTHTLQAMPELATADVAVGIHPSGSAENATVTVTLAPGHTLTNPLAQRIIERVTHTFPHIPPINIAIRHTADPDYLYLGDLGRLD